MYVWVSLHISDTLQLLIVTLCNAMLLFFSCIQEGKDKNFLIVKMQELDQENNVMDEVSSIKLSKPCFSIDFEFEKWGKQDEYLPDFMHENTFLSTKFCGSDEILSLQWHLSSWSPKLWWGQNEKQKNIYFKRFHFFPPTKRVSAMMDLLASVRVYVYMFMKEIEYVVWQKLNKFVSICLRCCWNLLCVWQFWKIATVSLSWSLFSFIRRAATLQLFFHVTQLSFGIEFHSEFSLLGYFLSNGDAI